MEIIAAVFSPAPWAETAEPQKLQKLEPDELFIRKGLLGVAV